MSSEPVPNESSRRVGTVALVIAGVVLAVLLAAQLLHGERRVVGSNLVSPDQFQFNSEGAGRVCQRGVTLPEDTASVRTTIGTYHRPGPGLAVEWRKEGRLVAQGSLPAGWAEGTVRVPVSDPPRETVLGTTVCFQLAAGTTGQLAWAGEPTAGDDGATVNGRPQAARVSLVSEAAGRPSLLSLWGSVADRFAAGNAAWMGPWTAYLILLLVLGALAAAAAALVQRPDRRWRRVPVAGWLCAAAAALGLSAWALLTPPMHVPDEISHVAYVQAIAESGELPRVEAAPDAYSEQERRLLTGLEFYGVVGDPDSRPPWTAEQEAHLRRFEAGPASREVLNASTASANPPLYYLLEAPVYWATPSGDLLDKLLPMRLLSVLLGSITVLAVFLFLRELLPRSPWLWPAGALACAFQPVFGFISSGVNADALLFTCSALTLLVLARVLRHGLTVRRGLALGAVIAAGVLTKPLFIGLLPAVALGVLVAAVRARSLRAVAAPLAALAAVAAAPVLAYQLIGAAAFDHPYFPRGNTVAQTVGTNVGSLREELSYVWQLWLPSLPIFEDQFPDILPLQGVWLEGFSGRLGWLDYSFPGWVLTLVTVVAVVLLVAALATLAMHRLPGRRLELLVYCVAVAGIAGVIGAQQYQALLNGSPAFTQARYLLPLLALYGGLIAVALRLAGRRAGPYVALGAVTLAALHGLSAMVLTVSRYYA